LTVEYKLDLEANNAKETSSFVKEGASVTRTFAKGITRFSFD